MSLLSIPAAGLLAALLLAGAGHAQDASTRPPPSVPAPAPALAANLCAGGAGAAAGADHRLSLAQANPALAALRGGQCDGVAVLVP